MLSATLDPWFPTICALLIPLALRFLHMFRKPSSPLPQAQPPWARPPLRAPISALLALYTLHTLYTLAFARPPNIFISLRLPLNAPQITIHAALLRPNHDYSSTLTTIANGGADPAAVVLPPALEKLLARLASSDARTMLVRFGQRVVQTCAHCATQADYALHALPSALLSYTLATAMLGAVTVRGTARESRRSIGLILLIVAALAEAYWACTVPIRILPRQKQQHQDDPSSGDIIMWHDTLWSLRHALFLALLLSIHFLPPPSHAYTPALSTTLAHLSEVADAQLRRTQFLRLSTVAALRVPELRARAMAFWARERSVGTAVRHDVDVRAAAERMGLGIAPPEGRTLLGSRDYVEAQRRDVVGESGEGALHNAARSVVTVLKGAVLRPLPMSDGGAQ
ncbi:hypothetical protein BJV74DRAFT_951443 [Russula compacta]|nr:hypothetical protein BJV74DRAFT_951443 [Russula compacta]